MAWVPGPFLGPSTIYLLKMPAVALVLIIVTVTVKVVVVAVAVVIVLAVEVLKRSSIVTLVVS